MTPETAAVGPLSIARAPPPPMKAALGDISLPHVNQSAYYTPQQSLAAMQESVQPSNQPPNSAACPPALQEEPCREIIQQPTPSASVVLTDSLAGGSSAPPSLVHHDSEYYYEHRRHTLHEGKQGRQQTYEISQAFYYTHRGPPEAGEQDGAITLSSASSSSATNSRSGRPSLGLARVHPAPVLEPQSSQPALPGVDDQAPANDQEPGLATGSSRTIHPDGSSSSNSTSSPSDAAAPGNAADAAVDTASLHLFQNKRARVPDALLELLKTYAEFAATAYHKLNGVFICFNQWHGRTRGTVLKKVIRRPEASVYCYLATNDRLRSIIIAFRGSLNVIDFINNSEFFLTRWPRDIPASCVHLGFLNDYLTVAAEISRTLDRIRRHTKYREYDVVVIGHSLGGALALIAAVDLYRRDPSLKPRLKILTYGQPRAGNRAFANYVNHLGLCTIARVTNGDDPVSRVPPLNLGFLHHNTEIWINRDGDSLLCDHGGRCVTGEDRAGSISQPFEPWRVGAHLKFWDVRFGTLRKLPRRWSFRGQ